MDILTIVGASLVTAAVSVLLKKNYPGMALIAGACGGTAILLMSIGPLAELKEQINGLFGGRDYALGYVRAALKITVVAYACQFAAEICRDAGENFVAGKVELAGKIIILVMTVPVLADMIENMLNVMERMI